MHRIFFRDQPRKAQAVGICGQLRRSRAALKAGNAAVGVVVQVDGEQQLRTGCLGAGRAAAGLEVLGAVGGQHRGKTAITRELVIDERGGFQRDVRLAQAAAEAARVLAADAWVDAAMSRVDGHNDFAVRRLLCHGGDLLLPPPSARSISSASACSAAVGRVPCHSCQSTAPMPAHKISAATANSSEHSLSGRPVR